MSKDASTPVLRYLFKNGDIPTDAHGKLLKPHTDAQKAEEIGQLIAQMRDTLTNLKRIPDEAEKIRAKVSETLKDHPSVLDLVQKINDAWAEQVKIDAQALPGDVAVLQERKEGKTMLKDALLSNVRDLEKGEKMRGAITTALQQIEEGTRNNRAVRDAIDDDKDPTVMILDVNIKEEKMVRDGLQTALDQTFQGAEEAKKDLLGARKELLQRTLQQLTTEISELETSIRLQSTSDEQKNAAVKKVESLKKVLNGLQESFTVLNNLTISVLNIREQIAQLEMGMNKISQTSQVFSLPETSLQKLSEEITKLYKQMCDELIGYYRSSLQVLYKKLYVANGGESSVTETQMDEKNEVLKELLPESLRSNLFPFEADLKKLKERSITPTELRFGEQAAIDAFFHLHKATGSSNRSLSDLSIPELYQLLREKKFEEVKNEIVNEKKERSPVALIIAVRKLSANRDKEIAAAEFLHSLSEKFVKFTRTQVNPELLSEDSIGKIGSKDETITIQAEYQALENQIVEAAAFPLLNILLTPAQVKILQKLQDGKNPKNIKITLNNKEFILSSSPKKVAADGAEKVLRDYQVNGQNPSKEILEGDESLLALVSSLLDALQKGDLSWKVEVSEITS